MSNNANAGSAVVRADDFAAAHEALRADPAFQYNLRPADPPPEQPAWLKVFFDWLGDVLEPVGRFLAWIGGFFPDAAYARVILWTVLAVAVLVLGWAIYNRVRHGEWQLRRPRNELISVPPDEDEWAPEQTGVRSWLEEADALGSEGRYAEAIRHLLFRSIEDIASRRPGAIRPALTSREIAASHLVPSRARELFTGIAELVERTLFGGRSAGEADWISAREAYENFTVAGAWHR